MAAPDARPTAALSHRAGGDGADGEPTAAETLDRALDGSLVCIRDLAGRPRGTGFAADHHGTVLTSHEAVDGLARLVLHAPGAGGRSCVVGADAVTALPGLDLALVRTEGLGVEPLPVGARDAIGTGAYVRIAAGGWREARVLGAASVTYTATEGRHLLDGVLELAIGTAGRDALRRGGAAAGGPVLDAATGTVVAVLGTALRSGDRDARFAVPLRAPALGPARAAGTVLTEGPLADLLARNAATVPAYGPDLNLAAVLELTATSVAQDGPQGALPQHGPTAPTAHSLFSGPYAHPALRPLTPASRAPAARTARSLALGPGAPVPDPRGPHGPHTPATRDARLLRPTGTGHGAGTGPAPETPAFPHTGRFAVRVERPGVAGQLDAFGGGAGPAGVLGLVGAPGSGRTTELAALTGRRARGDAPTPTLWLRGADLDGADSGVADAAGRALDRAARIVAAARAPFPTELTDLTPERVARLAHAHGRPLLLLLDGPEEMPAALDHRIAEWTDGTARWLTGTGARLAVACREEYWESAGARFPADLLHAPAPLDDVRTAPAALPPCLRLGDLTADEARAARLRYGVPDDALVAADAAHPLTLRLLAEVRAALPGLSGHPPLERADVLAAHLDLMCLRIAVRLAAENDLRGTAVRRLAARVSGQVHEAARRSLGPGGELDRATFGEVFPWGPAPARLGGGTGWASAVLTEGLLVPAGDGYRFAHEELADWIQGAHLDLDEALRVLVHRRHIPGETRPLPPVPHHRIGPVVQALLLLARQHGPRRLSVRLEELVCALDADPGAWWPSRLLTGVLLRLPDARPYAGVLRLLAERIVAWQQCDLPVPDGFGPGFWTALHLPPADHCDLLRRLLLADPAPRGQADSDAVGSGAESGGAVRSGAAYSDAVGSGAVRSGAGRSDAVGSGSAQADAVCSGPAHSGAAQPDSGCPDSVPTDPVPTGTARPDSARPDCSPSAHESATGRTAPPRRTGPEHASSKAPGSPGPHGTPDSHGAPDPLSPQAVPDPYDPHGAPDPYAPRETPGRHDSRGASGPHDRHDPHGPRRSRAPQDAAPAQPPGPAAPAAPAHRTPRPPRYLDAAARLLAADPVAVQPHLVRWFGDERPLPAAPHATVATAAQALLHTHRHRAPDDLTETLVESGHERADELLAALAEEEPAVLCRAVARWARDDRPDRRAAALAHALRTVPHVRADADLEALRDAALTLLARPADAALHGGALALLVADPRTRARHLPQALRHFAAGDPNLPPDALAPALATHPEAVLAAFGERLRYGPGATEALRALADAAPAALAPRVAALIGAAVARRPETAGQVAAYVDRRLQSGPAVRPTLFPLVTGLLEAGPTPLRAALGGVLATPGAPDRQAPRRELLDALLAHETEPAVLDAVLHAAARSAEEDLGDLVRRIGLLLVRTPEGAAAFDRGLAELGRHVPGFAARVAAWLADAPQDWAAVVGPSARRTLLDLAGAPALA
ncbi:MULTISPECIES: trypsin-like peptidase domain-containing protein [unclassified Streptomyces]|uniref:trypsin-like peptidase domain-containing protein n=1 Tax=unclassified Streptomyces TaxID=2593676 RepID=UPI00035DA09B|nr:MULTISPECIES: trypsin-like peptidase domain-containing protein [unclassified Streptomyces]